MTDKLVLTLETVDVDVRELALLRAAVIWW